MSILYVEDDPAIRESIARRLRRRGFQVVEAVSGEQALELAKGNLPVSLALLDIDLPGMSGVETLRQLRLRRPHLPAVFCSASLAWGPRQPLRELRVPEHCLLDKPCSFAQLLAALESALQGRSA